MRVSGRLFLYLTVFVLLSSCDTNKNATITDIASDGYSNFEVGVDFDDDIISYTTWVEAATENGGSERVTVALTAYAEDEISNYDVSRLWHSEWPIYDSSFERSEVRRSTSRSDSRVIIIDSMLKITTPLRGYDFEHNLVYQVAVIDVDGTPYTMPYERFDTDSFELVSKAIMSNLPTEIWNDRTYVRRMVTFPAKISFGDCVYSASPVLTLVMLAEYDSDLGLYITDYVYNRSTLDALNDQPRSHMWFDVTYSDGSEAAVLETGSTVSVVLTNDQPEVSGYDGSRLHYFYDVVTPPTKNDCTVEVYGDPVQYDISKNSGEVDENGNRSYNVETTTKWYQPIKFTFENFEETVYFLYQNTTFSNYLLIKDYLPLKVESVSVINNEHEVIESNSSSCWWANSTITISLKIEGIDEEFEYEMGFAANYYKTSE